jgi:hypothetical protein
MAGHGNTGLPRDVKASCVTVGILYRTCEVKDVGEWARELHKEEPLIAFQNHPPQLQPPPTPRSPQ